MKKNYVILQLNCTVFQLSINRKQIPPPLVWIENSAGTVLTILPSQRKRIYNHTNLTRIELNKFTCYYNSWIQFKCNAFHDEK